MLDCGALVICGLLFCCPCKQIELPPYIDIVKTARFKELQYISHNKAGCCCNAEVCCGGGKWCTLV
ncbi:hypothetical protein SLEP1_g27747 [Rubroshorea leprosula]|uniref:Uncharacterized protein n=1 Tax=Rubroshorea leprosula TaxID=152421 RepID=A0AAV5JRD5_9ROSI|nr:hypothetical protein SLEP1_g27747 [Rubroshorea leprosula]